MGPRPQTTPEAALCLRFSRSPERCSRTWLVSRAEFDGNVLRAPYESYLIPPAVLLTVTGMLGLAACGMAAFVRKTCEWSQRQDRFPRR